MNPIADLTNSPLPAASTAAKPAKRRFRLTSDEKWGIAFVTLFPVAFSLFLTFSTWNFRAPPELIGLGNFERVFSDPDFFRALGNTAVIAFGIVPLTVMISLGLALLTRRDFPGLGVFKTGFFLPLITTSAAIATVWYWMFAPDFGLINAFLGVFGIAGPAWLRDPAWAKIAVVIMIAWQGMGYYYLLFLAGLKQIPAEYYEAAAIDGAGMLAQFRFITLPMISPTMFFVITTMVIGAVSTFDVAYILTRGGPAKSTFTIVMYIYQEAFQFFRMGPAAVASWVLFAALFIVTAIQFRFSKRWVHYDS
jgi:multiple sugar transport system permease protein